MPLPKPPVGNNANPTLNKKAATDFDVSADAQRIMNTPADPMGFNPKVNQVPADPAARSYAERLKQRRSADSLKGMAPPLGGAPPIDPEKGRQIAELRGVPMSQPTFGEPPPDFAKGGQEQLMPKSQPQSEAPSQPRPLQGVGAAFQANQNLSQGKTKGPVTLDEAQQETTTARPSFSDGTIQALKMANENVQKSSGQGPVQPNAAPVPSVAQEAHRELEEAAEGLDDPKAPDIDLEAIAEARGTLMDPERKKEIESRLKPLDLGELITKKELSQTIPVIPGQLEYTIRTVSQRESMWILKHLYKFPGSVLYTQELINTFRLVCGLMAINGAYLPDHRVHVGKREEEVDEKNFEEKMFHIIGFPTQLIGDASVQQIWFQERVDKLFSVKTLKNG